MSESPKPATRERELEPGAVKRFEYEKWSRYFGEALSGQGQEHERNLWWEVSDIDTIEIVASLFERDRPIRILEAGCGSGGTNFHLAERMNVASIHLLDLTETALCFARELEPPALAGRVHYVRGDAFRLPFAEGSFDLTWNVGTIEHYPLPAILQMVGEMMRVTRRDGFVVAAIPNRYCLAVMKAWLLGTPWGRRWLRSVPGYRNDSEILYGNREIADALRGGLRVPVRVAFAGSGLWAGAPDSLVRWTRKLLKGTPVSFLTFFILGPRGVPAPPG